MLGETDKAGAEESGGQRQADTDKDAATAPDVSYLLGLLRSSGLDCSEAEADEPELRVLSGLLREHTLSMSRPPLHASQSGLSLHLGGDEYTQVDTEMQRAQIDKCCSW